MAPQESVPSSKSTTGLKSNLAGALCYVLGWITGLIFYLIEKEDKFVRFHALQSMIIFGAYTVVSIGLSIFAVIPYMGWLFGITQGLLSLLMFVLWIVLIVNAAQGKQFKLPIAGNLAEKNI